MKYEPFFKRFSFQVILVLTGLMLLIIFISLIAAAFDFKILNSGDSMFALFLSLGILSVIVACLIVNIVANLNIISEHFEKASAGQTAAEGNPVKFSAKKVWRIVLYAAIGIAALGALLFFVSGAIARSTVRRDAAAKLEELSRYAVENPDVFEKIASDLEKNTDPVQVKNLLSAMDYGLVKLHNPQLVYPLVVEGKTLLLEHDRFDLATNTSFVTLGNAAFSPYSADDKTTVDRIFLSNLTQPVYTVHKKAVTVIYPYAKDGKVVYLIFFSSGSTTEPYTRSVYDN